jgi:hypothetical protein
MIGFLGSGQPSSTNSSSSSSSVHSRVQGRYRLHYYLPLVDLHWSLLDIPFVGKRNKKKIISANIAKF